MTRRTGKAGNNEIHESADNKTGFQQSAENVGNSLRNDLVQSVSLPMGRAMADNIFANALMEMGKCLEQGEYGPLTQQMLASLTAGITNPLENWKAEIGGWYQPLALPSARDFTSP